MADGPTLADNPAFPPAHTNDPAPAYIYAPNPGPAPAPVPTHTGTDHTLAPPPGPPVPPGPAPGAHHDGALAPFVVSFDDRVGNYQFQHGNTGWGYLPQVNEWAAKHHMSIKWEVTRVGGQAHQPEFEAYPICMFFLRLL